MNPQHLSDWDTHMLRSVVQLQPLKSVTDL